MALKFHPATGTIVVCDYKTGFVPPEMVKSRPVIVVSPKLGYRNNLCTVVPLSTKNPSPVEDYHCRITLSRPMPRPFNVNPMWAKCDMLATVSFDRLDLISIGRRKYITPTVSNADLEEVRRCILYALGMGHELIAIEKALAGLLR